MQKFNKLNHILKLFFIAFLICSYNVSTLARSPIKPAGVTELELQVQALQAEEQNKISERNQLSTQKSVMDSQFDQYQSQLSFVSEQIPPLNEQINVSEDDLLSVDQQIADLVASLDSEKQSMSQLELAIASKQQSLADAIAEASSIIDNQDELRDLFHATKLQYEYEITKLVDLKSRLTD